MENNNSNKNNPHKLRKRKGHQLTSPPNKPKQKVPKRSPSNGKEEEDDLETVSTTVDRHRNKSHRKREEDRLEDETISDPVDSKKEKDESDLCQDP